MFPFRSRILANACAALMLFASAPSAAAQERGRLTGRVLDSAGTSAAGVGGVTVVAVNQVSTKSYRARTKPDGTYSVQLPAGAYRVPVRDRWRIGFPEYSRYGSVAGGRDIMFRRGSALNPYDQSILKGDYPIFGQHVFMILSATSSTVVQQQRTPTPSNVSSARP